MADSIQRIVLNPRAYIRPFVLLLVLHHLPFLIVYGCLQHPTGYQECLQLYNLLEWMRVAFISHLLVFIFLILSLFITLCSNVHRHHKVEQWIILFIFLIYLYILAWSIYGGSILSNDLSTCLPHPNTFTAAANAVKYIQRVDWIISSIVIVLMISSSYLFGIHTNVNLAQAEKRWQSRCVRMAWCFTCTSLRQSLSPDLLHNLGKMLSRVFVVQYRTSVYEGFQLNDLMFCLRLVSKAQLAERDATPSNEPIRFPKEEEATRLRDLAHYGHIAGGMYGWPLYVWYSPLRFFNLFRHAPSQDTVLENDNAIQANCASFLAHTGLPSTSLIYLSFQNALFMSPYAIVKDTERQELVISIRGSLSFFDYITDGLAHTEPLKAEELPHDIPNPQHTVAHCGMLRSARSIFQHLQTESRRELFWDFASTHCETMTGEGSGWKIVVCGHSLGAGVGGILALLLKRVFPQTKASLFAPPMVLDPITAAWTRSFMTTVVYGDDIVTRLSIRTCMQLREEMMTCYNAVASEKLYRVRYAKFINHKNKQLDKIDEQMITIESPNADDLGGSSFFVSSPVVNVTPNHRSAGLNLTFQDDDWSQTASQESLDVVDIDFINSPTFEETDLLDLPGQIIHMQSLHRPRTCSCTMILGKQPLTYSLREASYFRRIWITPRSIQDHIVHHYDRDLQHLLTCLHLD